MTVTKIAIHLGYNRIGYIQISAFNDFFIFLGRLQDRKLQENEEEEAASKEVGRDSIALIAPHSH